MGVLSLVGLRRRNQWEPPTILDHILSSAMTWLISIFYQLVLLLRGHPFHPPRTKPPVRVVCISDTHDQTVPIPPGDILVHAGDLTNAGTAADIQVQLDWLKAQPHPVKVVVAGNHDSWFDVRSRPHEDIKSGARVDLAGLMYLEGQLTVQEVKGRRIAIFGAPDIPRCGPDSFAFQYTSDTHPWLSKIPPETDILVTHCPPKHHRDINLGCPHLLRELWRVRPRLHVFGHVHAGAGIEAAYWDDFQEAYERLLSRPRRGIWELVIPGRIWLDALHVVYLGIESVLWKWLMSGPGSNHGSLLVNAAQMDAKSGKVKSRAWTIDI
ncbi:rhamnogalacturonate lyase C-like protein [Hapsidospora chrysogenum ATCC 11550]|uniref:Rhamnogalacturonate lyase C-like protein n=1 Tax=Hapsidospora chrysogenum (strain ATCC 11550 / CBS 779.69 / DSM 880 / IAM 14645 / JCM 23072 / IMI 49137) TaxID=857340 RepID=A0A086T3R8_HAPC1|nr:rhamnogalacturonate lyase C-like protein [Hapsidospora chrysogenum ATCC 11550]